LICTARISFSRQNTLREFGWMVQRNFTHVFKWYISTLEDETTQVISSAVKMEATGSSETSNVVIPYLNKPPSLKPRRHIGISYVISKDFGVLELFMNARRVIRFAEKVHFNVGHNVSHRHMCVTADSSTGLIRFQTCKLNGRWGKKNTCVCGKMGSGCYFNSKASESSKLSHHIARDFFPTISTLMTQLAGPPRRDRVLDPVNNSKGNLAKKFTLTRKDWLSFSERLGLGLKELIFKSRNREKTDES
jgi:hypothetical protein